MLADNRKGQLLQHDRQIDMADRNRWIEVQTDGGEVQDAGDSAAGKHRSSFVGLIRRNSKDRQPDAVLPNQVGKFGKVPDRDPPDRPADQGWVPVEGQLDLKPLPGEAAIPKQRLTEVSATDQRDSARSPGTQDIPNPANQLFAPVTNPAVAKLAKPGQVLADLGIGQAKQFAQTA